MCITECLTVEEKSGWYCGSVMMKLVGASLVHSQSTPLVLESDLLEGQVQAISHRSKTCEGWES